MIFSRCKTEKYIFGFGIHLEFGLRLGLDLGFGSGIQGSGPESRVQGPEGIHIATERTEV